MGSGGDKMLTITRHDKKVAWTLMPTEKMYMETNIAKTKSKDDLSGYKIEQTVVGPETVNGVSTTKENIVVKMDAIAIDKKQKHRFKSELTNLKVGKQDPKLFEVPAGYEKMSIPGMVVPGR